MPADSSRRTESAPADRASASNATRNHSLLFWFLADVVGLFSMNVGPRATKFSANVVPYGPMLSGPAIYVLRPLQLVRLLHHLLRIFVFPERDELCVPQVIRSCPLEEIDPHDNLGLEP